MTHCQCSAAGKSGPGRHATVLPALLLVLLPKCPLCLAGWFGVLGFVGVAPWLNAVWGPVLWSAVAAMAVAALAFRARRYGDARSVPAAVAGAVLLVAGKSIASALLASAGAAILLAAYAWMEWTNAPRRVES